MTAAALLLLASAALAERPGRYIVRDGDYLSQIARRCGISLADLSKANNLNSDVIQPGQGLIVPAPFRRTAAAEIKWRRPFNGNGGATLHGFGTQRQGRLETRRTGVDMTLPPGSNVYAPAHGVVRYRGHQNGYGVIMIIDHGGDYTTVLGPFDPDLLYAAVGQIVLKGDVLGRTGTPAEGSRPYLHIELRRHNKAVDPARLIH